MSSLLSNSQKRNRTIDVIKGLAIILVLITHYEWTDEQRKFFIFPFVINMAVPTFMIITGYVYSQSIMKNCSTNIKAAYQWCHILKRIIRYSAPLTVIVIWELLDVRHFNIVSMSTLDIIKWIINGTTGKGNYYYPIMIQMIWFFPVVFFILEDKKEQGLLICLIINATYELFAWAYYMNTECYRLLVFRYVFLISIGVYAFMGYRLKFYVALLMTITGATFIGALTYFGYETRIVNSSWATTNFISSMFVVAPMMWILQNAKIKFFPLELIGRASYHIFLVQMVYYRGYYSLLQRRTLIWQYHLLAGILVCIIIGIIFYCIDSPIQKRISQIMMKKGLHKLV